MNPLLDRHDSLQPVLQVLEAALRPMFERMCADLGQSVHSIESRVKSNASLAGKLGRPDRTYHALTDVTDLVGIRVITLFEDAVSIVAERVERTFELDLENSVDKRRQVELDRFGYRSLHYICVPPADLLVDHGLDPVPGLRFEVQLRTILQHAWAEMEHDLGYKSAAGTIPPRIRRRLSRLAGLLELGDEEFVAIKGEVHAYETQVATELSRQPDSVMLDRVSLIAFAEHSLVADADASVADSLGHTVDDASVFFPDYLVRALRFAGLDRIALVKQSVDAALPALPAFVAGYFAFASDAWGLEPADVGPIQRGYSLLFVAHLRLLSRTSLELERVEDVAHFFRAVDGVTDGERARTLAARLIAATRSALATDVDLP